MGPSRSQGVPDQALRGVRLVDAQPCELDFFRKLLHVRELQLVLATIMLPSAPISRVNVFAEGDPPSAVALGRAMVANHGAPSIQ